MDWLSGLVALKFVRYLVCSFFIDFYLLSYVCWKHDGLTGRAAGVREVTKQRMLWLETSIRSEICRGQSFKPPFNLSLISFRTWDDYVVLVLQALGFVGSSVSLGWLTGCVVIQKFWFLLKFPKKKKLFETKKKSFKMWKRTKAEPWLINWLCSRTNELPCSCIDVDWSGITVFMLRFQCFTSRLFSLVKPSIMLRGGERNVVVWLMFFFFFSFVCPEDSACLQRVGGQVQGTHEAGKDAKG